LKTRKTLSSDKLFDTGDQNTAKSQTKAGHNHGILFSIWQHWCSMKLTHVWQTIV